MAAVGRERDRRKVGGQAATAIGGCGSLVEEHHDPVAGKLVERSLELAHKRPQCAVVLAQEIEDFLGLGSLSEGGVAAQIAEHHDDLAAMAFEDFLVALRDNKFG